MTTITSFKVGETIQIAASIDDFCGMTQQGITFIDQNIGGSVRAGSRECKQISGIEVWARFAKSPGSSECSSCTPTKNFHDIAKLRTDDQGIVSVNYTVTDQDYQDYLECQREGIPFKLVTCISDDLGQGIIQKGKCSDSLTVTPAPEQEPQGDYQVTLKYWELPLIHRSPEYITNLIANFWNSNASQLTGWSIVSTSVNTSAKEVTLILRKSGSIPIAALILLLVGIVSAGIVFYWGYIEYREKKGYSAGYVDGYEARAKKDKEAIDKTDLSDTDKTKAKDAIDKVPPPTPEDIADGYQKYNERENGAIREAVKTPTIKAPLVALINSDIEISGTADPNTEVRILQDDEFSIWDIFKGEPFAFLDNELGKVTSDASGAYKITLQLDKQQVYRVYAKTGGKESKRSKIWVLEPTTAAVIALLVLSVAYYIYTKKYRRK